MMNRILTILCLATTLVAFGCENKAADNQVADEAKAEAPVAEKSGADEQAEAVEQDEKPAEELEKVEVAQAGTTFDPAVQAEQLPAGAWYCDMGTVHFAAMQKPADGNCPECGMKLKQYDPQKLAAQKEEAVEAHPHPEEEHGHAHDNGGHAPHGDEPAQNEAEHGHAH